MASLQAGDPIEQYQIQRNPTPDTDGNVYLMTFASRGRRFLCPLVRFQARTVTAIQERVEENPARETAAAS